jgi:hypothetical protein
VSKHQRTVHQLEQIAADCDILGRLAADKEARRRSKLNARKLRKLAYRLSRKHDLVDVEKRIALGSQRLARQKGLVARIERMGADSRSARDLLAVFEQTQALFEQQRERILKQIQDRGC